MMFLRWLMRALAFPFVVLYEMLRHAVPVVRDVLTPGSDVQAAFVEVPLRSESALEFALISNLIALTPGTTTVALRTEPEPIIWVHGIYIDDHDQFAAEIRALEHRVLGVTRLSGDPGPTPEKKFATEPPR